MPTERENIDAIQSALATMEGLMAKEVKRAKENGNAAVAHAWGKALHSTLVHHDALTDLLMENYPNFSSDVVLYGIGR